MSLPKTAVAILAEEICAKYPEHSNLGLAKRLRREHPEVYGSVEAARSAVRNVRGAIGKQKRPYATQVRKKGKAGAIPSMPPSFADAWEPFVLDAKNIGIISDVHIPYHSVIAFDAAVRDLKTRALDCLLINGDFADFYQISRHQRDPKKRRMSEELKSVVAGLEWLRHEFPSTRIVLKLGNHEERWNHYIWNRAPEIYDVPACQIDQLLKLDEHKIELVGDQRPIMAGKLPIMHGHELGKSIFSPVNAARGAFLRTQHTVLVGHSHQSSGHADTNLFHDETFVWSVGCLCDLTPEYARVNRWNYGFAFVKVSGDGNFSVSNMRISKRGEVRTG